MMKETMIMTDVEIAREILNGCGVASFAVYCAIQALGSCTLQEIQEFCGLSSEETTEACVRLGFHQLGVIDKDTPPKLRLVTEQ